ncbi:m7GpppN-mRNA hydrolase [Armadillidium nasatum]|uniref:mRNA-decapping enzyme 2 n=1 Tax=Armadillidium nasatum TaxID=96803 RepID=A0A5N5TCV6_9CRUS|nr:m7GpppN-mRNA hydrolase [Armadillidium nasatum]
MQNQHSNGTKAKLAYWFYLDEYVEEDDSLNTIKFVSFALRLLQHVKMEPERGSVEDMLQDFRDFKQRVPTYGAIIISTDLRNVLLVRGFLHGASWGFPKGKINVEEEPFKCAIREVLEETGYDISSQINKDIYFEKTFGEQKVRLYIIPGVSMTTEFIPRTKGEIKELKWFPIHQLPTHKNDRNYSKSGGPTNKYYMVMPFVKPLKEWLAQRSRCVSIEPNSGNTRKTRRRHRSLNAIVESYQRYANCGSSSTPIDSVKSKNHQFYSPLLQGEDYLGDHPRVNVDNSPKNLDKSQNRVRKTNFSESLNNDEQISQKLTFKSRCKCKGGSMKTKTMSAPDAATPDDVFTNPMSCARGSTAGNALAHPSKGFRLSNI